jgi:hypothetical protein
MALRWIFILLIAFKLVTSNTITLQYGKLICIAKFHNNNNKLSVNTVYIANLKV